MEELCGNESKSLVSLFDDILRKEEEARAEASQTGPEHFLKVLQITALAKAREAEDLSEAREQILLLEEEKERLLSQVSPNPLFHRSMPPPPLFSGYGYLLFLAQTVIHFTYSRLLVCLLV